MPNLVKSSDLANKLARQIGFNHLKESEELNFLLICYYLQLHMKHHSDDLEQFIIPFSRSRLQ